ncbi:hypothetical protein AVEN_20566-1, partial [Araneus ventricosus]
QLLFNTKTIHSSLIATYEMLSSIVKEHQSKQSAKREELEKKRKEAVVAASTLTSALVDHLNVG